MVDRGQYLVIAATRRLSTDRELKELQEKVDAAKVRRIQLMRKHDPFCNYWSGSISSLCTCGYDRR